MSINSLQDDMSRRAASMAAMAQRMNNPQEIQAMQQRLVQAIQSGAIKPYIGIPLVQELTEKLNAAKAQAAQAVAGAGTPPAQGGEPIAQQVMQQAAQADQSQGVEALPSNLPSEYAGGGIIAFEDGGHVAPIRFQNTGAVPFFGNVPPYTATSSNAEFVDFLRKMKIPTSEYVRLAPADQKNLMDMFRSVATPAKAAAPVAAEAVAPAAQAAQVAQTAGKGILGRTLGALTSPFAVVGTTGAELSRGATNALSNATPEQREQMMGLGADPSGTSFAAAIMNAAKPAPEPRLEAKNMTAEELGPVPGSTGSDILSGNAPAVVADNTPTNRRPSAGSPGITGLPSNLGMNLPAKPNLFDYSTFTEGMDEKQRKASEKAVKEAQDKLESFDTETNKAREERLSKREAGVEKDSAMGRALNLMSLGFGIAGSKERTLAGALGNEGRQGIADLIKGEAATRAAKEKLEDARDSFEQQKNAAKKGNFQAAQRAGERASDEVRAGTQLAMTGAHYGNTEANQLFATQSTNEFHRASLAQNLALEQQKIAIQRAQAGQKAGLALIYDKLRNDPANKYKSDTEVMGMAGRIQTGYDKAELGASGRVSAALQKAIADDGSLKLLNMQLLNAQKQNKPEEVARIQAQIQQNINQHKVNAQLLYGGDDQQYNPSASDQQLISKWLNGGK